jgi:DNA-binding NtrC family response regulator
MQQKHFAVLVIANSSATVDAIRRCLENRYHVETAGSVDESLKKLHLRRYEFIFIDIALLIDAIGQKPDVEQYKDALALFWQIYPSVHIVIIASSETIRDAVYAVKAGADNYINRPINPDEVSHVTEIIYEQNLKTLELDYLRDQFWEQDSIDVVRTNSPLMKAVFEKVRSVAPTRTTVMLTGETGTGKGVVAKLVHRHSNRLNRQYIGVHCGAIPDTLVESELFGHEKGAFTGAVKRRLGKFEIARGGTIFLDEIGTISATAQIKLLQVLQERTFQRVGGEEVIESDARVIAASNTDLKAMTETGSFRTDLYYRLNVFPIEIPSLRDRKEDIPILVEVFLKKLNQYYAKDIADIHPLVLEAFQRYHWPGNIRELENLVERSYILEKGATLTPESFPGELFEGSDATAQVPLDPNRTLAEVRRDGMESLERSYLEELLRATRGRINETAEKAGIGTRQLHKLLTKYGIKKERFK